MRFAVDFQLDLINSIVPASQSDNTTFLTADAAEIRIVSPEFLHLIFLYGGTFFAF